VRPWCCLRSPSGMERLPKGETRFAGARRSPHSAVRRPGRVRGRKATSSKDPAMHRVAVLAVPAVKPFDLSMPSTLLDAVEFGGRPGYEVTVCTAVPGTVAAFGGIEVVIRHG